MSNYIILNNREKYGTVYQTEKTRQEVMDYINFDSFDVIQERETSQECIKIINEKGYKLVSIMDLVY
jgi:hypothetical protein